jgi:hypothetical protein
VNDTVETVGGVANDTVGTVGEVADDILPDVNETVGTVGDALTDTVGSLSDALGESSLLDLDVNLDLDVDAAAPISATVAANANVAAPIDAAVSANVLSPDSISLATADQQSLISQTLVGEANATSNQISSIMQGEEGGNAAADAGDQTGVDAGAGS